MEAMAQEKLNQQAEAPMDILEEGEVVDAVLNEPRHSLSDSSVDVMEVHDKTVAKIADLYETLLLNSQCNKRKCTYESTSRDRLKIHAESHYIIYVAKCTFFSSCRDSVKRHVRRQHLEDETILQVDHKNWSHIRRANHGLPKHWPHCSVAAKEHCLCKTPQTEKN